MKSFIHKVVGGAPNKEGSLVGKCIQCSNYNLICEEAVGSGGYASIYRVRDQVTNAVLALKHLRLHPDSDAVAEVRQEMKIMHLLGNHPNILKLHAASFAGPAGNETDAFMVMDYCPITLLGMMQRSNFQLDEFFIHEVFSEVCHAVAHMHLFSPPYAHRDIKAENVLKTAQGKWVLCDFGSSTTKAQVFESQAEMAMEEEVIRRTTTPAYRAPEMWDLLSRHRIDTKVDIWALGVLLYVLVFGKLPFQGDSKLSVLFGKYDMPPGKNQAFCDLIKELLTTDPALRPDILTVISRLDGIKQSLYASINAGMQPQAPAPLPSPAQHKPAQQHPQQHHQQHQQQHAQHAQHAVRQGSTTSASGVGHPGNGRPAPVPTQVHGLGVGVPASHAVNHQRPIPVQQPQQPGPTSVAQRAEAMIQPLHAPPAPGSSFSTSQHLQPQAVQSPPAPITRSDHSLSRATQIPPESRRMSATALAPPSGPSPPSELAQKAVQLAASTPLFVPSDGALQYGSSPARAVPGPPQPGAAPAPGPATATSSTSGAPARAEEPSTATLIDVDVTSSVEIEQHLLDAQPPGKKHGHKHKRSSSFGNQSFEPDWGEKPAFSDSIRVDAAAAAGAHPGLQAQHSSSHSHLQPVQHGQRPRGSKTEAGLVSNYKMSDAAHHTAHKAPLHGAAPHPHPSAAGRKSLSRGGSPGSKQRPGPADPRHDFGSMAFRPDRPMPGQHHEQPGPRDVQGQGIPPANGSVASHPLPSGVAQPPATSGMEVDLLRVQVKGLTATQQALSSRVKQLEDTIAEQAALIRALQKEVFGSRAHSSSGAAAPVQPKRLSTEGSSKPSTTSTWQAFEPNSPH